MNLPTSKTRGCADLTAPRLNLRKHCMAALLVLATCHAGLFAQSPEASSKETKSNSVSAKHILGLEGARKNAQGRLTVSSDGLKFQKNGGAAVELKTASILSVSTGQQDKQVGGIPVTLGRAATPFGGGRAIALVTHKKYDTLTLEYKDDDGALHGAVFQLAKGQAQLVENELAANGVHVNDSQSNTSKSGSEDKSENK